MGHTFLGESRADPYRTARLVRERYEADLGPGRSFLPATVPPDSLPAPFDRYLEACRDVARHYAGDAGGVRTWLDREFGREDPTVLAQLELLDRPHQESLLTALSVLGHTYRWDRIPPCADRFGERQVALPPGISGPWRSLARAFRLPPVGTAWSLHLCNWGMTDRPGGSAYVVDDVSVGNIRVAHNWLLPPFDTHLENFSLSFVLFEAKGARVLSEVVALVEAASMMDVDALLRLFNGLDSAIRTLTREFSRSVRSRTVDPSIWLTMVQPTYVWSAESDRPGCIQGGPSGMQLPVVQALDAVLGVAGTSALAAMAHAARYAMPYPHRRFLRLLDRAGPIVRTAALASANPEVVEGFNRCVWSLRSFRSTHRARGAQYLRHRPSAGAPRASTGLTIGPDDDATATFEAAMTERVAETEAAGLLPISRLPS